MSNRYTKEVITYVLRTRLTPLSWLSIARETSISSPHTTQSYVESMERLSVFKVSYFISPDSRVLYRKNKKVHVTDPFLYSTLSHYTGVDVLEEQVVESVLACHISRVTDVFFWKNGKEVDVVGIIDNEQVGFEAKWGVGTWVKPKHLKRAFLLKREILPVFLASVDWKKL